MNRLNLRTMRGLLSSGVVNRAKLESAVGL
jgi:hypothetical protein